MTLLATRHLAGPVLAARVPPGAIVVNSSTPLWYLTRATGLVALVLLTASMALGLLASVRYQRPAWPRFVTAGLHQNSSLLALAFTGIHVVTTLADSYAPIRVQDVVIPFISAYRPLWLGLGRIAFDLSGAELRVNPIACEAHGLCAELLPELITADPWGYPIIAPGPVPPDLIPLARRAVAACPTLALLLGREG